MNPIIDRFLVYLECSKEVSRIDDSPEVTICIMAHDEYGVDLSLQDIYYFGTHYEELVELV